jgi:hypothetical protein
MDNRLAYKIRSPLIESKVWEPSHEETFIMKAGLSELEWVKKGVTYLKTSPLPSILIYDDEVQYCYNRTYPHLDALHTKALLLGGLHVVRVSYHCTYEKEFLKMVLERIQGEKRPILCVSDTSVYEYLILS